MEINVTGITITLSIDEARSLIQDIEYAESRAAMSETFTVLHNNLTKMVGKF